jgi:hypothetical protein
MTATKKAVEPKKPTKKERQPATAKAGEKLTPRAVSHMKASWPRMFAELLTTDEACTIQPKSEALRGQWFCADCGKAFQNNMGAWSHSVTHRRVWWASDFQRFEEP